MEGIDHRLLAELKSSQVAHPTLITRTLIDTPRLFTKRHDKPIDLTDYKKQALYCISKSGNATVMGMGLTHLTEGEEGVIKRARSCSLSLGSHKRPVRPCSNATWISMARSKPPSSSVNKRSLQKGRRR